MNRWEALEVLGLEERAAGLTQESLRRTYLRALRDHPPERDPDGFARLRAAFEYLKRVVPRGPAVAREVPARVDAIVVELDGAGAGADVAVAPVARIVDEIEPPRPPVAPIVAEVAPIVDEIEPPRPPPVAPIVDEIEPPRPPVAPIVAEVDPPRPPVAPIVAEVEPPRPPPVARPPLPPLAPPIASAPSLGALVRELLALVEAGDVDAAITRARAWRRDHDGDDLRDRDTLATARWALASELVVVAPELAPPVRVALARALGADDLSIAHAALRDYRAANPFRAEAAHHAITRHAPLIASQIVGCLDPPRAAIPRAGAATRRALSPSSNKRVRAAAAFAIALVMGTLVVELLRHAPAPTNPSRYDVTMPELRVPTYQVPEFHVPEFKLPPDFSAQVQRDLARELAASNATFQRDLARQRLDFDHDLAVIDRQWKHDLDGAFVALPALTGVSPGDPFQALAVGAQALGDAPDLASGPRTAAIAMRDAAWLRDCGAIASATRELDGADATVFAPLRALVERACPRSSTPATPAAPAAAAHGKKTR